jgi:hypothetical protein
VNTMLYTCAHLCRRKEEKKWHMNQGRGWYDDTDNYILSYTQSHLPIHILFNTTRNPEKKNPIPVRTLFDFPIPIIGRGNKLAIRISCMALVLYATRQSLLMTY